MNLRSLPSQIWMTLLLGSLSTLSVFWIARDDEVQGSVAERKTPALEVTTRISTDMHKIFEGTGDWQALCKDPMAALRAQDVKIQGRSLTSEGQFAKRPSYLGQLEKDALRRCQAMQASGQFCFETETDGPTGLRLFEVHLEFRRGRQLLSCDQLAAGADNVELLAFYTAYWGEGSGKFERLSSGLSVRRASSAH